MSAADRPCVASVSVAGGDGDGEGLADEGLVLGLGFSVLGSAGRVISLSLMAGGLGGCGVGVGFGSGLGVGFRSGLG